MIFNQAFVDAVRREQHRRGDSQITFSRYLGVSQSTLSKFYRHGVKDNITIKILRKYPHFAIFFRSEDNNEP